jgi:hypothetical protein
VSLESKSSSLKYLTINQSGVCRWEAYIRAVSQLLRMSNLLRTGTIFIITRKVILGEVYSSNR